MVSATKSVSFHYCFIYACLHINTMVVSHNKWFPFGILATGLCGEFDIHFCLLFGYGASAINPYLVNEIIAEQLKENDITAYTFETAIQNYNSDFLKVQTDKVYKDPEERHDKLLEALK